MLFREGPQSKREMNEGQRGVKEEKRRPGGGAGPRLPSGGRPLSFSPG